MKKLLSLIFIITLSGCSQFNNSDSDDNALLTNLTWEQQQQTLQQLDHWTLTGKLAIFLETDRQSANIYWQQQGDDYSIQLTTFIGTRILQVTKDKQGVEIINNDDEVFTGQDANTLIKQLSPGLDLPIAALQQWIKGNPANASYQLNDQQQVSELVGLDASQNLWEVDFQQYQVFSGTVLPTKVNLKRDDIRVKIAINQWKVAN
ncbi:lipoprotein insertase outer membrane protein LolB [Psychromonas sp. SR45-3]|uniref:lipoprotein insertase outer membrane protein LolB n=1 Tax=Psychromonas sp. SR45-3 TaxID=2760930 RepID=UPI0015FC3097|nr:lipoprotein insertase outer membrane protein LolB [Psychromonas sp. SR45-3]MBB1273508.1 outer membrane lipoprotein LolB [Psychromonas sp. SR45-3]